MKTLWELKRHDCRWPVDRVDDAWHFCGEPAAVSQGLPHRYCAAHAALVFARMGAAAAGTPAPLADSHSAPHVQETEVTTALSRTFRRRWGRRRKAIISRGKGKAVPGGFSGKGRESELAQDLAQGLLFLYVSLA